MNKPLLICMTPIRNEAWVLHAFLKAASLWADYIIIADQQSTDGSREIALSYPKVILIDNNNPAYNEAERQKMLVNRAREIEGDKILFGLDADEIFSANFVETSDWQKILNSKPGDVFWFRWAELNNSQTKYWESDYFPWMFHDNGTEPHGNYVRNIHSMRIPYPIEEKQMSYVSDFHVLHLLQLNKKRLNSKSNFYQFVDWELNKRNYISLSRLYNNYDNDNKEYIDIPDKYLSGYEDIINKIDTNDAYSWHYDYILDRISSNHLREISKLDIWYKNSFLKEQITDPRPLALKLIHFYLRLTSKKSSLLPIRIIDKMLKLIFK